MCAIRSCARAAALRPGGHPVQLVFQMTAVMRSDRLWAFSCGLTLLSEIFDLPNVVLERMIADMEQDLEGEV